MPFSERAGMAVPCQWDPQKCIIAFEKLFLFWVPMIKYLVRLEVKIRKGLFFYVKIGILKYCVQGTFHLLATIQRDWRSPALLNILPDQKGQKWPKNSLRMALCCHFGPTNWRVNSDLAKTWCCNFLWSCNWIPSSASKYWTIAHC